MIDTDNYAAAGIEIIWLPAGEPHVKMPFYDVPHVHIYAKLRNASDVLAFMAVCSALENQGVDRHVLMPYLPGGRQDRVQEGGSFTAEMFARLLAPAVSTLTAVDIHSTKAALVYAQELDLHALPLEPIAKNLLSTTTYDALIVPDEGAVERCEGLAEYLDIDNLIYCTKQRDPDTGRVVVEVEDAAYPDRLIVTDDICDGGATFLQIAEQIHAVNPDIEIDLFVTHGIFSKGFDELSKQYNHIFTTDSFFVRPETEPPVPVSWSNLFYAYIESLTP